MSSGCAISGLLEELTCSLSGEHGQESGTREKGGLIVQSSLLKEHLLGSGDFLSEKITSGLFDIFLAGSTSMGTRVEEEGDFAV